MRIVFVLCEGPHDVAFLSRLLSADGYLKYRQPLSKFPKPLDGWMTQISRNLSIEDLSLDRMYDDIKAVLPSNAMLNEEKDQLILLYSMSGDSHEERRNKVISTLKSWSQPPVEEKEFSLMEECSEIGNNYGLIVIFDADDMGVNSRIEEAKANLCKYFPIVESITKNGEITYPDEIIKIGIYIFADPSTKKGTLESILLPLMRHDNESMFDDAKDYLSKHHDDTRLKSLIFKKTPEGIIETRDKKNKFHPIKSIMGVVGQLQNSGTSNTVCIEKADYITLEKIQKDSICQDILQMFSKL